MKFRKVILYAALLLPLCSVMPAFAEEAPGPDSPVSSQTRRDAAAAKTLEQRVKDRKANLEERLTTIQQTVVKSRCRAAHGLVKASQARIGSFVAKRTKVYSGVVGRLGDLSPKLQAAGVDTTTYDTQVAVLKTKADAYSDAVDGFKAAIDDLAAMDCTEDPEGFVATLRQAAEAREDVIAKGKDFRTYLKDTLKPTLAEIKTELQSKAAKEEDTSNGL